MCIVELSGGQRPRWGRSRVETQRHAPHVTCFSETSVWRGSFVGGGILLVHVRVAVVGW